MSPWYMIDGTKIAFRNQQMNKQKKEEKKKKKHVFLKIKVRTKIWSDSCLCRVRH